MHGMSSISQHRLLFWIYLGRDLCIYHGGEMSINLFIFVHGGMLYIVISARARWCWMLSIRALEVIVDRRSIIIVELK